MRRLRSLLPWSWLIGAALVLGPPVVMAGRRPEDLPDVVGTFRLLNTAQTVGYVMLWASLALTLAVGLQAVTRLLAAKRQANRST